MESPTVRTNRDGLTVIKDLGAANTYTNAVEPGDFNWTVPRHAILRILDRTEHATPRRGDAGVVGFGWSVHLRDLGSAVDFTLPDICEQRIGSAWEAARTSTLDGLSDVVAYDVDFSIDGSFVGEADKTLTFDDGSLRGNGAEGGPNAYTVAGESSILAPTFS